MTNTQKTGKNMMDMQENNRAVVLNTLRDLPGMSRSQIAKATALQQATITNIVNDLIKYGIVVETELQNNKRGRRAIGLELNSHCYRVVSVLLTRTSITVGLFDIAGREYDLIREAISIAEGADVAFAKMIALIHLMLAKASDYHVLGIGVALPGPYLKREGVIAMMADFPGWEGKSVLKTLVEEFGDIVYTVHDASAISLAEWWFGRRRNESEVLLTINTCGGIGGGLVDKGRIYGGFQGIDGIIGHTSIDFNGPPCACGNRGCLRNYCSENAVIRQAYAGLAEHHMSALASAPSISLRDIIDAALHGDDYASGLIRQAGQYMGYGLINAIYYFNPDTIVLTPEFADAADLFLDGLREVLKGRLLPVAYEHLRIEFSRLDRNAALMGVVAMVTDNLFIKPSFLEKLGKPIGIDTI